jgi:hypothetical protein
LLLSLELFSKENEYFRDKIKQATGGEKRNVGRLLKSGCNEEENEEILKLFKKHTKKKG